MWVLRYARGARVPAEHVPAYIIRVQDAQQLGDVSIPPHVKRAPDGFATRSSDHFHRVARLAITPTSLELGSAPSRPRRYAPTAGVTTWRGFGP
jgi:hypothetical protein